MPPRSRNRASSSPRTSSSAARSAARRRRLFELHAAGILIEATRATPYDQTGESKYGKPIIDRIVRPETSLRDGAKCALISMGSTIRSNLSVGPPLDLTLYRRDALQAQLRLNVAADDEYFKIVRPSRSEALRQAFRALPDPPWG